MDILGEVGFFKPPKQTVKCVHKQNTLIGKS